RANEGRGAYFGIDQTRKVLTMIRRIIVIGLTAGDEVRARFRLNGARNVIVVPARDRRIPAGHEHVNAGIKYHLAARPRGRQSLQKCLGDFTGLLYHKIQIAIEEHRFVFDDRIRPFRPESAYLQYWRNKS